MTSQTKIKRGWHPSTAFCLPFHQEAREAYKQEVDQFWIDRRAKIQARSVLPLYVVTYNHKVIFYTFCLEAAECLLDSLDTGEILYNGWTYLMAEGQCA